MEEHRLWYPPFMSGTFEWDLSLWVYLSPSTSLPSLYSVPNLEREGRTREEGGDLRGSIKFSRTEGQTKGQKGHPWRREGQTFSRRILELHPSLM